MVVYTWKLEAICCMFKMLNFETRTEAPTNITNVEFNKEYKRNKGCD